MYESRHHVGRFTLATLFLFHVNIVKELFFSSSSLPPFLVAKADAKINRFSLPFQIFSKVFSNFFRAGSLIINFTPRFTSSNISRTPLKPPLDIFYHSSPFRFCGCKDNSRKSPFPNFLPPFFELFYKTLENKYLKITRHVPKHLKVSTWINTPVPANGTKTRHKPDKQSPSYPLIPATILYQPMLSLIFGHLPEFQYCISRQNLARKFASPPAL